MTNKEIAGRFTLLSKLMELHDDNQFKAKSYAVAAFRIKQLPENLDGMSTEDVHHIAGIGDAIGRKIIELISTGSIKVLDQLLEKTPEGIIEMLRIKGLGAKKISVIWREMEIENLGELLYAINENRLLKFPGFGQKTQENIKQAIEFYLKQKGQFLYAQVEQFSEEFLQLLMKKFPSEKISLTGNMRRHSETIDKIEYVIDSEKKKIKKTLEEISDIELILEEEVFFEYKSLEGIRILIFYSPDKEYFKTLFETTGCEIFVEEFKHQFPKVKFENLFSEEEIFERAALQFVPPFLRENERIIDVAKEHLIPKIIQPGDIRGLIHCHTNWSDGNDTIEQIAEGCISRGLEYMVLSDHSKAAFYAQGLSEERIREQHHQIDLLNDRFKPFKIFKSIECDILADGSLDYSDKVLSTFDLVIVSVHSNLKMDEQKAMKRLLRAIGNPFTTILGHMTGRLLLSRQGYPVDHKAVIDACAVNNVVIEINANPRRLDMRWQWIEYALSKGVLISIDPDAHSVAEINNNKYGVLVAQKAMVTQEQNLSSFSLEQFETFLNR